ncbi:MAG: Ig-like domain-containing protein [Paludibacteraceae bacterium]|nr:Ig-like domain-containing protein [Paludibacteraceae bacterium]
MKKQLFLLAIVAGVLCFNSCKTNSEEPGKTTGNVEAVTINPREVVLTANEPSVRLGVTLTPEDASATVVWSSSDTTIATVTNRGVVDAQGHGECYIYAAVGDIKDSCYVAVKTFLESIVFTQAYLGVDTTYALDTVTGQYVVDTIKASDGTMYPAYKALAKWELYSDGFYIDNTRHLAGTQEGVILEIEAPMYYSTGYLLHQDRGTIFGLGDWAISTKDYKDDTKASKPGYVDETEYLATLKQFVEAYNAKDASYSNFLQAAANYVHNPALHTYSYETEDVPQAGYYGSYIPDAIVKEGHWAIDNNADGASDYMYKLEYSTMTFTELDGLFGLNVEATQDAQGAYSYTILDDEIHYADPITATYGVIPPEDQLKAKRFTPIAAPAKCDDMQFKASLDKQLKDKNIRVIRVK